MDLVLGNSQWSLLSVPGIPGIFLGPGIPGIIPPAPGRLPGYATELVLPGASETMLQLFLILAVAPGRKPRFMDFGDSLGFYLHKNSNEK